MLFFKPKKKYESKFDTVIGPGTVVQGPVGFTGSLVVFGCIQGDVSPIGTDTTSITIMEGGEVYGSVKADFIVIRGVLRGVEIQADELISVEKRGFVSGRVVYEKIKIATGSVLEGELTRGVSAPVDEIPPQEVISV